MAKPRKKTPRTTKMMIRPLYKTSLFANTVLLHPIGHFSPVSCNWRPARVEAYHPNSRELLHTCLRSWSEKFIEGHMTQTEGNQRCTSQPSNHWVSQRILVQYPSQLACLLSKCVCVINTIACACEMLLWGRLLQWYTQASGITCSESCENKKNTAVSCSCKVRIRESAFAAFSALPG